MGKTAKEKIEKYFLLHNKTKTVELFADGLKYLNPAAISRDTDVAGTSSLKIETEEKLNDRLTHLEVSSAKSCSCCKVEFENIEDQRIHFKLDWHRFNLKQNLCGKPVLSEEQFDTLVTSLEEEDDNISISGSETESEQEEDGARSLSSDDNQDQVQLHHPKLFFLSKTGAIVSLYKCLLLSPGEDQPTEHELVTLAQSTAKRLTWTVLLLGGGHFAGAVFKGGEVLVHKTFHCYTVRAKQGGGQGAADNRSGQHKSAGASLRRYNEMALIQHIQDIVKQWADYLGQSQLIFYRAASSNKNVLFGGKNPLFNRNDNRLRTIPFPTKRATFSEVKRVHQNLSTVDMFQNNSDLEEHLQKTVAKKRTKIHRSKSREAVVRDLPKIVQDLAIGDREENEDLGDNLVLATEVRTTDHLKEFDNSEIGKRKGKRKKNKPSQIQKDVADCGLDSDDSNDSDLAAKKEVKLKNDLLTAVRTGSNKDLENCLLAFRNLKENEERPDCVEEKLMERKGRNRGKECLTVEEFVNTQFGDERTSCLHIAAKYNHRAVLWTLLDNGADPSVKDKSKRVPYCCTNDKETRNSFRKYYGKYPEKYDYKTAQIPPPLSAEEEAEKMAKVNEKKKAQRLAKKEKDKAKKEEIEKERREREERDRFLNLSDREKRALAAERRIMANTDSSSAVQTTVMQQRCYTCAADITGKVPFEYSDYRFCSVSCLKKHRDKTSGK